MLKLMLKLMGGIRTPEVNEELFLLANFSLFRWIFHFDVLVKLWSGVNVNDVDADDSIVTTRITNNLFLVALSFDRLKSFCSYFNLHAVNCAQLKIRVSFAKMCVRPSARHPWHEARGTSQEKNEKPKKNTMLLPPCWHLQHLKCIAISAAKRMFVCFFPHARNTLSSLPH